MQAIGKATDFFPGQDFPVKYFLGFTFSHSILVHLLQKVKDFSNFAKLMSSFTGPSLHFVAPVLLRQYKSKPQMIILSLM